VELVKTFTEDKIKVLSGARAAASAQTAPAGRARYIMCGVPATEHAFLCLLFFLSDEILDIYFHPPKLRWQLEAVRPRGPCPAARLMIISEINAHRL
jgi:hypothetical protein